MRKETSFDGSVRPKWLASAAAAFCAMCPLTYAEDLHSRIPTEPPTKWTEEQIKQVAEPVRAGRSLTPKSWPGGNKVAVIMTWDLDNESYQIISGRTDIVNLSKGEYGARSGFPRIIELHDRLNIPGTLFIPVASAVLAPQIITELKKRPQLEVGLHGWIHEVLYKLDDKAEEQRLLNKQIDFWTKALGTRPVGSRTGLAQISPYTIELLRNAGFEYDSSISAMDEPYELLSYGKPSGLVELPVDWVMDDGGAEDGIPEGEAFYQMWRADFDRAYKEGTLLVVNCHSHISAHRMRIKYLEDFVLYMKSKPGVWFATARQVAEYVKQQNSITP